MENQAVTGQAGAERQKSRIEQSNEDVSKATSRITDLTKQVCNMADCIDGGQPETDAPDKPRECRAGQVGNLLDSCDRLHRRINTLAEQVERLQTGLGV